MSDQAPVRDTEQDRARGNAILAVMQAKRAYRAATEGEPQMRTEFDEAYEVVTRLADDGFLTLAKAA